MEKPRFAGRLYESGGFRHGQRPQPLLRQTPQPADETRETRYAPQRNGQRGTGMGDKLGYCPNVKEYKKNPDAYKGSITDVCTIVRVAITGKKNSPDLATIMNVIGKDRTIGRLDKFLAAIGK